MSTETVELVRSLQPRPDVNLVGVFRDDDDAQLLDALGPFLHDDFVAGGEVAGPYEEFSGLAGLKAAWTDWLEPWATYRVEIEDVIDAGDDVVVLTRDYGRRSGMTSEVSVLGAALWRVRDGKVGRVRFYANREAGLQAAGLRE